MGPRTRSLLTAAGALALVFATGAPQASAQGTPPAAAPDQGSDVRVTFERPVVYSGQTHLAWMSRVAFAQKRGETIGALLRIANVSNDPVWLVGGSRESLTVNIDVRQGSVWKELPLAVCGTGTRPLLLAPGESFEVQVPLPAGEPMLRIHVFYRKTGDPDLMSGGSLRASSDGIDVHRWSGGSARPGAGAATRRAALQEPAPATPAPALPPGVHLTYERTASYSGKTHEAWTTSYAFAVKRGDTFGAQMRVTNATGTPIWVLGFDRDALSIRVEVRQRNGWRDLLISEASAGLKPLALAAGESIALQVPLPDDAQNMRVSVAYRTNDDPDWTTGGWQTLYSDAIDVHKWAK